MKNLFFLFGLSLNVINVWAQFTPGIEYTNQPGLAAINILPAYNQGYSGLGVRIGIVDTGINPKHVEFNDAIVAGYDAVTGESRTSGKDFLFLTNYQPETGHGSHVAGISAARLDGAARPLNMQGVAYKASLVISAFDQSKELDAQFSSGLNFAVSNNAQVINNSWNVNPLQGTPDASNPAKAYSAYAEDFPSTVRAIRDVLAKNAVLVFSAGNNSFTDPVAPATTPTYDTEVAQLGGFITVVATTNRGKDPDTGLPEMARDSSDRYTNYCGVAKNYCISAPGGLIGSGDNPIGVNSVKSTTDNGYIYGAGTSMAAPFVTGAVAVVAEKYPWMSNRNLATTILTTGTTAANPSEIWGRGLLDLGKAINGPAIFEEDFEANVTSGYASKFSNPISGTFGIKKLGVGSLELSGINTFTGKTYLNGGTLIVNAQDGLGAPTADNAALQFNGGTLKLGVNFDLLRDVVVNDGGGALNINSFSKTQTFNVTGTGQFGIKGGGTFTFAMDTYRNTQTGGTAIGSSADNALTTAVAINDNQLGASKSKLTLDNGQLNLLAGYVPNEAGKFNRPIEIGSGNGTINTGSLALAYTGGEIGGTGKLSFLGSAFTMGADLKLNGYWGGNFSVPSGLKLSGTGGVDGNLTVLGILAPGNSPGTMTVSGNVVQNPGSTLQVDIDGTGTGNGAGNYDRLILTGATSTYTAGGTLAPILRGISGDATNTYSPPLGQGFQIITAPGGILGNFAAFTQPTSGLLPGTQFDTVFGATALSLYATPASYSNIAAAGVATNSNRQQIGDILQPIRPTTGVRETNATRKLLFDSLAPQTTSSLAVAMDQLGGVGYGQIIGMNFENSKFLADQMASTVALHRRGESGHLITGNAEQTLAEPQEELWGTAVGRLSDWRGDNVGYNTYDVLGGLMAGVQKRMTPQSLAGFSLAYTGSNPSISQNMGNGPMQNLQVMGYGSHRFDNGFYAQGLFGGGGGSINASRNLSMMSTSYNAQIQTANLAGSVLSGWGSEVANHIRYETGIGINYLGMRQFAFNDSGNQNAYALSTQAGNTQSLVPNLNASVSIPFKAYQIEWRAYGLANVGYETANNKITLQSTFLGSPITVESGSIGRTRLNLGLGISGHVGRETKVALEVSNQSAQNWNATAANVSVRVGF